MTKQSMKRGGRRALSIFMSLLMIMTAWVFVAPEVLPEAEAINSQSAGSYQLRITYDVGDANNSGTTTLYVTYKPANGRGSQASTSFSVDDINSNTGDNRTSTFTVPGFPTIMKLELDQGGMRTQNATIKKGEIGNGSTWITGWQGSVKVDPGWWGTKDSGDLDLTSGGYPSPSCTYTGHTVVGLSGAQETRSYTLNTVKDQYGVDWGFTSVKSWATSNSSVATASGTSGVCTATFKLNSALKYSVTLTPTLALSGYSDIAVSGSPTITVYPAESLSLNTEKSVALTSSNYSDGKWYCFTPSTSGQYIFFDYSTSSSPDGKVTIYQLDTSATNEISSSFATDDDQTDGNIYQKLINAEYHSFYCKVNLTAGTTYLVNAASFTSGSYTYPMKVCKAVEITFNTTGGVNSVSSGTSSNNSDSFSVILPAGHTMRMNQTGFTRSDHTLLAWSTKGTHAQDESVCMVSDTITIPDTATTYYALWNPAHPTPMTLNIDYPVTIDKAYEVEYLEFTPATTHAYVIYSHNQSQDSYGLLMKKSDWATDVEIMQFDDDGGEGTNFQLQAATLQAGVTYLIGAKFIRAQTGSMDVRVEEAYTVHYDANGGSGAPADQVKLYDVNLTLSSTQPTRTGYTFLGWSTHPSSTTADYAAGATYTANADVTLYAVWQKNQSTLTVDPNGGVWDYYLPDGSPFTGYYQDTLSIPDPTRTGYTFTGWTLSGSGNGTFNSSSKIFTFGSSTSARTLTAGWSQVTNYQVTYPGAHTTGSPATASGAAALNATVNVDANYHLTDNVTVKVGTRTLTRGTDYTYTLASNHRSATVAITSGLIGDNVTINAVAEACSGGTATCTQKATCSVCNTSYGSVDSNNHDWDYANATFNWSGYTCANATVKCTRNNSHTKQVATTVTSVTTAPAVCNANGTKVYTAKFIANNTEYTSTKTETLTDTSNHDYIAVASASHLKTAATCTTAAVYYKYCSRCGANHPTETFTSGNPDTSAHNWGAWTQVDDNTHKRVCANSADHVQIENHSWTAGTATPATCTTAGSQPYTCATCGGTKTETIPALGHNFTGAWTVRTNATCTTAGVEFRVCARTGCSVEETRAIPATGHTIVAVAAVAPKCTDPGTYGYTYCSVCKQILTINYQDVTANNWTTTANANQLVWTDANAHNWGAWSETTPATCTAAGVESRTCSYCGQTQTNPIPALGHDVRMIAPVNPTCMTPGNYSYTYCDRCKKVLTINFADVASQNITYNNATPSQAVWTDANAHNYGAFTETTAATCTTDGVMTATCSYNSSHTQTKVIPKLGHAWGAWTVTAAATCTTDGVETRTCSNNTSHQETRPIPKTGHNWTSWTVTVPATCTANGTETRTCQNSGCSETETRTIPKLDHNWSAWTDLGETQGHSRTCSVGNETETEAHTWECIVDARALVDADPDCTTGVKYYKTCSVCGRISTTNDSAHTFVTSEAGHRLVAIEAKAATCETAGNIQYWQCAVCHKYFNNADGAAAHEITAAQTVVAALGHDFDLTATPIEVTGGHQYPCTRCGGYGFGTTLGAVEAHTFDQQVAGTRYSTGTQQDCTTAATYYYSCKCGASENNASHTFTSGGTLGHNMTAHPAVTATCAAEGRIAYWECSRCHRLFSDAAGTTTVSADALSVPKTTNHSFGDWTTLTAATCTEEGSETRTCAVCGKVETRTTAALTHSFTSTTYRTNNNGTHNVKCIRCDVYGPDVNCTNTTSTSTAADCLHKGTTTYTCADCGGTWVVEGAYGSHVTTGNHHAAVPADCTTAGTVEYWTCSVCNKYFADAAGSTELSLAELTAPVLGHQLTMTPASGANCTTAGNSAYYTCARCGKYFSDANGQYEIAANSWVIPATGHDYTGAIRYKDANEHEYLCKNGCGTYGGATAHVYDKAVEDNAFKASDATCTAAATYYYSCECGAAGTATFTVGDPLGHAYNSVKANSWVWTAAGDGYTAKATLICANDNSHEIERDAVVTYTTNGATCGAAGTITYTATVTLDNGSKATDTKTETVEALPHSYDLTRATYTWTASGDTYSVTATVPCSNNASHPALTETVTATKVTTPATCEVPGSNVFTATFTRFPTQTRTDPIPKLGHAYGQPVWTWADNNVTATATFTCANDSDHKVVITTATVESVTQAATCTTAGSKNYTATVSFDRDGDGTDEPYTDTKTGVVIPALGHDFDVTGTPVPATNGHNYKCSRCNEYGYDGVVNDVEPHTFDKAVATATYKVSDATCTTAATYYYSCVCGEAGPTTFTVGNPLGHNYNKLAASNAWTWAKVNDAWTAKATLVCANDNSHTIQRDAVVTFTTNGATCGAAGSVVYTATVTLDGGETKTDTKTETVAALPHDYDWAGATYTWTPVTGGYEVTATAKCKNDATHTAFTETVTAVCTSHSVADCENDGVDVYEATFTSFPKQTKTDTTTALGHTWGTPTWTWGTDNVTATATFTCGRNNTHVQTITVASTRTETTAATCTESGTATFDAVVTFNGSNYTATTTAPIAALGHDWGEWSETTAATCDHAGVETRTCQRANCGATETRPIAQLTHRLVFVPAVAPTCTADGSIAHYECALCGGNFSDAAGTTALASIVDPAIGHNFDTTGTPVEHGSGHYYKCTRCGEYGYNGVVGATTSHVYDQQNNGAIYAKDGSAADCTHQGEFYYSCACGANEHDDNHTFLAGGSLGHVLRHFAAVTATCKDDGNLEYWYCSRCGNYYSDANANTQTTLAAVTISHTTVSHTMPNTWTETVPATCTEDGLESRVCTVCGVYTETQAIPALNHDFAHGTDTVYICYNNGTHAVKCSRCDVVNPTTENCTDSKEIVSTTAADCTHLGTTTYRCTRCGYVWTEENTGVGPHSSTPTHHAAVPATCTTAGNIEYWTCEICGQNFSDAACTTVAADVTVAALAHAGITAVPQQDADCTHDGVKAHFECPLCNKMFSDAAATREVIASDLVIPALGHNFYGEIRNDGASGHSFKCTRCNEYGNQTAHTFDQAVVNAGAHVSDADCLNPAKYHYSCVCGAIDTTGTQGTFDNGNPTGHAYNTVKANSWVWTEAGSGYIAKATLVCANDNTHEIERDAIVTYTTVGASCTGAGTITYTATITLDNGSTDDDTKTVAVAVLGHDYDYANATYVWSADNSTCTASATCKRDGCNAVDTETVTAAHVNTPATCENEGSDVYTATFTNTNFKTQTKTISITRLGHDYQIDNTTWHWNAAHTAATVTFVCQNDEHHTLEVMTDNIAENRTPATCETAGSVTYTATLVYGGATYTNTTDPETIPATGHDWGDPVWTWDTTAADWTATVTFTCANNSNHVATPAVTMSNVSTAATCTTDGSVAYTATATGPDGGTYTDTATKTKDADATLAAFGHRWGDWSGSDNNYSRVCANDPDHIENATIVGSNLTSTVASGAGFNATITPDAGYKMAGTVSVYVGTTVLDAADYTYTVTGDTATLTIAEAKCTGNITVNATALSKSYNYNGYRLELTEDSFISGTYTVEQGATLAQPTRTGFDFSGWEVMSATAGENNWTVGTVIQNIPTGKYGDVVLKAVWTAHTYTVEYNTDGGSAPPASFTKTYDIDATLSSTVPTKDGYTFGGWGIDGDTYAAGATLDTDYATETGATVTLTAIWTTNGYEIVYDGGTGASNVPANTAKQYGVDTALSTQVPTKTAYTFDGWLLNSTLYNAGAAAGAAFDAAYLTAGGNVTVTAQWSPITYTATFNYDNGSNSTTATFTVNDTVTLNPPTKDGYTFAGWKITAAAGNWELNHQYAASATAADADKYGNVTFTAQWTKIGYTYTLLPNGGTLTGEATGNYDMETAVTLPAEGATGIVRAGYSFAGWKVKSATGDNNWDINTVIFNIPTGKYGDVTLEAVWTNNDFNVIFNGNHNTNTGIQMPAQQFRSGVAQTLNPNQYERVYTVSYEENGGSSVADATVTYSFLGWSEDQNAAAATYANEAEINMARNNNLALYAVWQAASTTLPAAPSKTGYTFRGWYTTNENELTQPGATFTPTADTTFYAKWEANAFTVNFDKGHADATGTMAAQPITADTPTNLTANAFTRSYDVTYVTDGSAVTDVTVAYTFAGWLDQDGNSYIDEASINTARDEALNLTAQWTAQSTVLPATSKAGYTFLGWYVGDDKIGEAGDSFTPAADTELTAKWATIDYTATFIYDNGDNNTTATFTKEDAVTLPTPTKGGYTFAGWKITAADGSWINGTQYQATDTSIAAGNYGNVTFTAQWTEDTNTITFQTDGGEAVANVNYKITDATADLPTTTKEGYDFAGWLVTTAAGNWEADSVVFKRLNGKYGNVTLTAQWTNGDFNVIFDGNGNTDGKQMGAQTFFSDVAQNLSKNIYTRAYTVTYDYAGATAGAAPATDTANYVFEGWATTADAAEKEYADEAPFTAHRDDALTLYAVWTPASVTLPTPTRIGYTFAGWFNGAEEVTGATFTPTANTTLTAHWTANDFTVTFAKGHDDATGTMPNQTIKSDVAENLDANAFTRSYDVTFDEVGGSAVTDTTVDYSFNGWLDQDGNSYSDEASIDTARDDALNLTAQWTAESTVLPNTTKDGYTFAGWYNGSTKVGEAGDSFTPAADTALTAHWTANSYTATFIYDNGDNNTTAAFTKEDAVTLPTPTRNGYTFAGWTITAADGSWTDGAEYAADVTSIAAGNYGDVTFTAQWTRNTYSYTGKILASDAENAIEGTYNVDEAATLAAPTRAGYSFAGWRVAEGTEGNWDLGTVILGIPAGKYGDVKLVAVWTNNDFNVTFDGNGNTNTNITMPAQQFRSGVAQNLNPNQYERKYAVTFEENGGSDVADATVTYRFLGWATAADGDVAYANQAEINMARNENLALYAVWEAASTTIPAAPTKFGYTFDGWYDNASFTGDAYAAGTDFTPTADTVFYAKWVAQSFDVTFAGNGNNNDAIMAAQEFHSGVAQALTANTFERRYTVTYDENGGSTVDDATVAYSFLGWSEDAAAAAATYTDGQRITLTRESDLALNAVWSANSTALPTTTKDGYTFAGWYNGNTKVDGATFTPTADTTLTAHWDAISYTATFVYKNGSDDTTAAFTKETDVTFPAAPERTGYTFAGWTVTKAAGSWANGTAYAAGVAKVDAGNYGDVTFTAQWTANEYTYTLLPNNGTLTVPASDDYTIEDTVQLPSQSAGQISRTGYSFAGWKVTTSEGNWDENTVIFSIPTGKYGDVTLEAVWTESDFNVTFLGNGSTNGVQMPAQQFRSGIAQNLFDNQYARAYTVTYDYDNATSGAETASTTISYTFNGWKDQDGVSYTDKQNVSFERTDPVTMTAQWTPNSTTLPTPEKTGYTFAGWYNGDTKVEGTTFTPTADTTLTAHWDANDFTVTFDKNNADATGTMAAQTITCGDETPLTANAFERKYTVTYDEAGGSAVADATVAYTFAGWATAADGDVVYTDGQTINLDRDEDLTLYAVWTAESTALPTTAKDGYTFAGWYNGDTKVEGASFTPTANTTLTAHWDAIGYTATFIYANGTTEFTTADFIATDVVSFPTTARAGYTFDGWKITAAEGDWTNGTQYAADAANAGDAHFGNVTFTAQWAKITYTYKFETANGTMADRDGEYNIESAPIALPTSNEITRDGYTFGGWKVTTVAAATNWHLGDIVTEIPTGMYGNVRFTAQWTKNHFFVIFDGNGKTDGTMQNQQFISDEEQALNPNAYERKYTVTFNYNGADGGEQPESLTANFGFAGWKNGDETYANQAFVTLLSKENVTIIAQWTPTSITLPTPTKTGYTFRGWYKDAELTEANKAGDQGDAYWPNEDTVNNLYAKWNANEYTYSFDVNDGSDVSGGTYTIETATIMLPTASEIHRDGYSFEGWVVKTANGDENSWTVGDTAISIPTGSYGNVEFQAQWSPITYTYTFDTDEGTMADFSGTYTIESPSIALPTAADITREGYDFGGWIVKTGVGNWTAAEAVTAITTGHWGNVTFKAKWLYGVFGVTYYGDNLTGTPAQAQGDTTYIGTVTAEDGYHLLDTVTVKVGSIELTRDTDYTYVLADDNLSATVTINADKVIGHVSITAEAAAHDFTDHYVSNGDGTHKAYCVCGQYITEDCVGGTATCIEQAVCDFCGDHYGEYADHIITTVNARAATCTQNGTRALTYCAVCKLILTLDGTDISASGKKYGVDTETYVLPALGHNYIGELRDNGNGSHSFKCVNGCGTYGDPVLHTFDRQVSTRDYMHSNAKCETAATYYYSCACGAAGTETYEVGEPLGHAWVRKPAQASTCTTAGHSEYDVCERCNKAVGFEPYAVLGHGEYHFDSTRSGKLNDGTFKYDYYKCERCDDYYIELTVAAVDQNNQPIKDVEVSLVNHGIKYTGTTNANGEVKFDHRFQDGEYKITMIYTLNRVMITTNDVLKLEDGNLTGTISHMDIRATYTTDEQSTGFRCSMCDFYEARYELPVYGWAITAIHYFVHTIQHLIYKMSH